MGILYSNTSEDRDLQSSYILTSSDHFPIWP